MSLRRSSLSLSILAGLFAAVAAAWPGPSFGQASGQPSGPRVIEVVAKRFAFEPAVIEVTLGESVRLMVTSADGVHGVEIKKFKVGKEVPRGGTPVAIDFTANAVGRFPILCSEYCGDGHEDMKGMLVVVAKPTP